MGYIGYMNNEKEVKKMKNVCEYCGETGILEDTNYNDTTIKCCENCRRWVKSEKANFLVDDTFICEHCDEVFHNDDMHQTTGFCEQCITWIDEQDEPSLSARERN